jgi:lipopolysaccharide biosynthesis glycosyltransferase
MYSNDVYVLVSNANIERRQLSFMNSKVHLIQLPAHSHLVSAIGAKSLKYTFYGLICAEEIKCPSRFLYLDADVLIGQRLDKLLLGINSSCPDTYDMCTFNEPRSLKGVLGLVEEQRFHTGVIIFNKKYLRNFKCQSILVAAMVSFAREHSSGNFDQPVLSRVFYTGACSLKSLSDKLMKIPSMLNTQTRPGVFNHFTNARTYRSLGYAYCMHLKALNVSFDENCNKFL